MSGKPFDTTNVLYHPPKTKYSKTPDKSIDPIGIDTEADTTGKCFMICTGLGDIWTPEDLPECFFDRKHRDKTYVAYNLKYDMGALIQHLDRNALETLRKTNKVEVGLYKYKVISNKLLSISKGHKYINIYDMLNYYNTSLEKASQLYLGEGKLDQESKEYTPERIAKNWDNIAEYCIKDAVLVERLAKRLIEQFNSWGMHVRKLYSTAHVSYAWFSSKCGHPSVEYFWRFDRKVLDYAMRAYNGGKFEVTKKGSAYFYEYDIASAYPHSIRNLVSLENCRVVWSTKYRKSAVYAFLNCTVKIPLELPSPVAVKRSYLNTYPVGEYTKVITLEEYDYLIANNTDITINDACWIHVDKKTYPYRAEIDRLFKLKAELKSNPDKMAYHTIKILLNSLYGKFVQLIPNEYGYRAGSSWNPIYGAVITAHTRVLISDLQRRYPSIWAVHTDSVISDIALPFPECQDLGALSYELEGNGVIAGCGVYQIGDKSALRGVSSFSPLVELCKESGELLSIPRHAPHSWRQVVFFGWDIERINRFEDTIKLLRPNSDRKRLWITDAKQWNELLYKTFESEPFTYSSTFYSTSIGG